MIYEYLTLDMEVNKPISSPHMKELGAAGWKLVLSHPCQASHPTWEGTSQPQPQTQLVFIREIEGI